MYIIKVAPLVYLPRSQSQILSYFYSKPLKKGVLVEVPLRKKDIKAIVIDSQSLKSQKMSLRKMSDFSVKKISKVISIKPILNKEQIEIALWLSENYFAPLGTSFKTVLPKFWDKKKYPLKSHKVSKGKNNLENINTRNYKDHYKDYEDKIEKNLKSGQVLLLVPERSHIDYFKEKLAYLEPIILTSEIKNEEYFKIWKKIQKGEKLFIISTRVGLFLPFKKLKLLIVDDESNEIYKSEKSPKYYAPDLAIKISEIYGASLIINSLIPRLKTYEQSRKDWFRYVPSFKTKIVNMVDEIKNLNYSPLSKKLQDSLLSNLAMRRNTIIFVPRKGYASALLCKKCGHTVKCPNCEVLLVVYKFDGTSMLKCHHCEHEEKFRNICKNCKSHQLKPHGIAIQRVISETKSFFNNKSISPPSIYLLTGDIAKKYSEGKKIINDFRESRGGILIATQSVLSHKYNLSAQTIAVINSDALSGFVNFETEEKVFRILNNLGAITKNLLIQTYNPDDVALLALDGRDGKDFFDNELLLRKKFNYPPYSRLVKVIFTHSINNVAERETKIVTEKIKRAVRIMNDELIIKISEPHPALISKEKGKYIWQIVIKFMNKDLGIMSHEQVKRLNNVLRLIPISGWEVKIIN